MRKYLSISLILFCILSITSSFGNSSDSPKFIILPITDSTGSDRGVRIVKALTEDSNHTMIQFPQDMTPSNEVTPKITTENNSTINNQQIVTPPDKTDELDELYYEALTDFGDKLDADFLITGTISRYETYDIYTTALISVNEGKPVYTTTIPLLSKQTDDIPDKDIWLRIDNFLSQKSMPIEEFSASTGNFSDKIFLTWKETDGVEKYQILRSTIKDGVFLPIGITADSQFSDKEAVNGIIYYYSISPIVNSLRLEQTLYVQGYKKPVLPKSENLKKLLGGYNKPKPKLSGDAAAKAQKHIDAINQYYINRTKLNLTLFMIKGYVDKKDIFVFSDFASYTIDTSLRTIVFTSRDGSYEVAFKNNTFFKKIVKLNDPELTNRLLQNSVLFCIPNNFRLASANDGSSRYIHSFEAIGLCTQYYPQCSNWPDSTIIFGTSNKDLKAKIEEARNKNNPE